MKMRYLVSILLVWPLLWGSFITDNISAEEVLSFAIGEWAPFTGKELPSFGLISSVVQEACAKAGITPRFDFFPWPRAEYLVKTGRYFATFPYLHIPEREQSFYFSEPLFRSQLIIITMKDNKQTEHFEYGGEPESLKPFRIGTTAGSYAVIYPLKRAGVVIEESNTIDLAIQKLYSGRLDFIIDEYRVAKDAIQRLYAAKEDRFVFLNRPFADQLEYRLLVSKNYPDALEILERLNKALLELQH